MQYLEDDRNGHLYGKHVVAAIQRVRSLAGKPEGSYDMREVMGSFVTKLTFREMCTVLKEQKGWRQVRDFFGWMKLQVGFFIFIEFIGCYNCNAAVNIICFLPCKSSLFCSFVNLLLFFFGN